MTDGGGAICGRCGGPVKFGARFCGDCGYPVEPSAHGEFNDLSGPTVSDVAATGSVGPPSNSGVVPLSPPTSLDSAPNQRGTGNGGFWLTSRPAFVVVGALALAAVLGVGVILATRHGATVQGSPVISKVRASALSSTTTTTLQFSGGVSPSTSPLTTTESTAPVTTETTNTSPSSAPASSSNGSTAELRSDWPHDPNKCGPAPADQSQPYSPSHQYQVTATVHLWSAPTTSSTPLAVIDVTTNGPGGVGCPSGSDPLVAVTCATNGLPITGPFGTDALWDQTSWNGRTGYLSDEWVDTKWDGPNLPPC